ncbi:unnamed protein product [Bursaphelenchus xylophilus]|uniref:(pine wood nematode) hypothetical protein n=1 Tax=Bursaphelenchus xylophilus TaxID=6326 RepID=A0A7I8XLC6_BURXY|nr:unnamed protein product [Bursaphelenchus xylophilus]CAG9086653.1 unnamed protein product [Bursaphelenchus xylophilus]
MVRSSDVSQAESLKQSTRHETVNSTSRNDEKSRPPGEQHSEHSKRSFNKILTRKTRTDSDANGIGNGPLVRRKSSSFESSWNGCLDELKRAKGRKIKSLPGPRRRLEMKLDDNCSRTQTSFFLGFWELISGCIEDHQSTSSILERRRPKA